MATGLAFIAGLGPTAAAAGDWNEDGKLDLAVANQGLVENDINYVSVLLNISR